jgi:hypothetical protein
MQENMLENTQQIINFKNKLNQVTEEHQKLTREFDDEKERFRKSICLVIQVTTRSRPLR